MMRRIIGKRHLGVVAAFMALATAAGCAGGTAGTATTETVETVETVEATGGEAAAPTELTEPVTISFLSWATEAVMRPLVDKFEEQNPNITVEFSWAPPVTEYIQALQTRMSAGNPPTVFMMAAENRTQLMQSGAVIDLTDQPFMANISEASKKAYSDDSGIYAVATNSWGGGILYNVDLLNEAGCTVPFPTWDDFVDCAHKLEALGVTPYLDSISEIPVMVSAMLGRRNVELGGNMDEQIFNDHTLTFEEAWTPVLERYQSLVDEGILSSASAGLSNDQVIQEFQAGRVAMMSTGSWQPGSIRSAAPDLNFSFTAVPGTNPGEGYWGGAVGPGYAISSAANDQERAAALRFVEFLQSPEAVEHDNLTQGSITTTLDYEPIVDDSLTELAADVRANNFYLPMVSWPRAQDILQTTATANLQRMVTGAITPQEAAASLDAELARVG